jgi:hypothetical protein
LDEFSFSAWKQKEKKKKNRIRMIKKREEILNREVPESKKLERKLQLL